MRIALAAALLLASTHLLAQSGYGQGDPFYDPPKPIPGSYSRISRL
jgi:hypothetical protein